MDASLLPAALSRSKLLRERLAIEPATYAGLARLVAAPNLNTRNKRKSTDESQCFFFGSGDWIRTSDLVVTRNPMLSHGRGLYHHPPLCTKVGCKALPIPENESGKVLP